MFILLTAEDQTRILLDVERIICGYEDDFKYKIQYTRPNGEGADVVIITVMESPEEIAEKIDEVRGADL